MYQILSAFQPVDNPYCKLYSPSGVIGWAIGRTHYRNGNSKRKGVKNFFNADPLIIDG